MRIDILTLFPAMFPGVLRSSILDIAISKGIVTVRITNIRNFAYDKHRSVDDRPYGGGPGMLLKPEPICRAVESIWHPPHIVPQCILFTPQGELFQQQLASNFSKCQHLILICGHYEGFDDRIRQKLQPIEISIGDYVLTGGEIPAMVFLDAVVRLIPGVVGCADSIEHESFYDGMLEYPQYTRPPEWRGLKVPEVLISGHHENIRQWKREQAYHRTQTRRPDLLAKGEHEARKKT